MNRRLATFFVIAIIAAVALAVLKIGLLAY